MRRRATSVVCPHRRRIAPTLDDWLRSQFDPVFIEEREMSKVYPSNPPPPPSSPFTSHKATPLKLASNLNGPKLSSTSIGPASSKKLPPKAPLNKQQLQLSAPHEHRPPVSFKDRLLDAIYFLCPDCSIVQCSAILLGLMLTALLTVLFLYLGNFWSAFASELIHPAQGTQAQD